MVADIHILHQSEFYRINDFNCHCDRCSVSQVEYDDSMFISFVRKGFFEFQTFRRNDEMHIGRMLVSKPGYEHTTRHIDSQPDLTTSFEFTTEFFRIVKYEFAAQAGWFLNNNDIHSLMLYCNAELDLLHYRIFQILASKETGGLQLDELAMELVEKVMAMVSGSPEKIDPIPESLKRYHLGTIENAKEYILGHFNENISLHQLAQYCHVSLFHFSRIFKSIMNVSPHQYLAGIRLNHARILLTTTGQPVTDIAFACGYNSLEHFTTAYRRKFATNPGRHRAGKMTLDI